jgi:hypothetical protein
VRPLRWIVRQAVGVAHDAVAEWRRLDSAAAPPAAAPARDPHSTLSGTAERATAVPARVWNQPGARPVRAGFRIDGPQA